MADLQPVQIRVFNHVIESFQADFIEDRVPESDVFESQNALHVLSILVLLIVLDQKFDRRIDLIDVIHDFLI